MLQHVARDDRLLCGPQAQVLPVVVHLDDLPQVHRTCRLRQRRELASVAICVEEGYLGAMRAASLRFARRVVHTLFARTAGVNVSRVPQVPVWTCGGYLGIRCAEGIAFTHTPR